ncbi:hypothetical protein [Dietzia sp. DQ12-76]|nr:hypothetical protein [Dietzia sp. DQ12-76]
MTRTILSPAQVDELVGLYEADATIVKLGEQFVAQRRTAASRLRAWHRSPDRWRRPQLNEIDR